MSSRRLVFFFIISTSLALAVVPSLNLIRSRQCVLDNDAGSLSKRERLHFIPPSELINYSAKRNVSQRDQKQNSKFTLRPKLSPCVCSEIENQIKSSTELGSELKWNFYSARAQMRFLSDDARLALQVDLIWRGFPMTMKRRCWRLMSCLSWLPEKLPYVARWKSSQKVLIDWFFFFSKWSSLLRPTGRLNIYFLWRRDIRDGRWLDLAIHAWDMHASRELCLTIWRSLSHETMKFIFLYLFVHFIFFFSSILIWFNKKWDERKYMVNSLFWTRIEITSHYL